MQSKALGKQEMVTSNADITKSVGCNAAFGTMPTGVAEAIFASMPALPGFSALPGFLACSTGVVPTAVPTAGPNSIPTGVDPTDIPNAGPNDVLTSVDSTAIPTACCPSASTGPWGLVTYQGGPH